MARFYPLYVRRSDGKIEIVVKGKRKEPNQPTDDQLDQKPDKEGVSDFYREIAMDEPKHLDWRRKLGGMLARELGWKEYGSDIGYILVSFPENYRLYEHIKKTERDGKLEVKSKTHAAGGNDRQDAYLYGHPVGRKKRFRSPNDFFPHLLWLCTDESGDPDNCSCKICSPEDLESLLPKAVKQEQKPATNQAATQMARQTSQQSAKIKQEPSVPSPRPASVPATQQQQSVHPVIGTLPTPLPPPKNADQKLDRQYQAFMYRQGEVAWFKRGQAWGIGLVLQRWVSGGLSNSFFYKIQPLSYPFNYPQTIIMASDQEMRPWLAWSVPKFTIPGLNELPEPPRYETADWPGMSQGRYGRGGDMEVDGSILAAKYVDSTFTLFDQNKTSEPEPGLIETHYNGIFLGAEKIWAGDPVRLFVGSGTDIMVVHSVVETKRVSAMNNQVLQHSVKLLGDVYSLASVQHHNPAVPTPAATNNNPHLPPRLNDDLAYRNARSVQLRRVAHYWRLMSPQHRLDLSEIKGRWYEASLVLPILDPGRFDEANRKGEIQESSLWMNSRGDCINSNRPPHVPKLPRENYQKATRKEAFVTSIPPDAVIKDGSDPPLPDNVDPALTGGGPADPIDIDPRFDTADDSHNEHTNDMDEFMNLDGMDVDGDQMPGFGQEYGSQGTSSGYF